MKIYVSSDEYELSIAILTSNTIVSKTKKDVDENLKFKTNKMSKNEISLVTLFPTTIFVRGTHARRIIFYVIR